MKITKQQLKQIIKEELTKIVREATGDDFFSDREANPHDGTMYGDPEGGFTAGYGDAPEDIARQMLEAGVEITDESAEQAAHDAGVLDDDIPDFVDAIVTAANDATLYLSTPTEDPWKMKARLGIGGSVHDRLGGPRTPRKK